MEFFRSLILLSLLGLCLASPVTKDDEEEMVPFEQLLINAANSSKAFDFFYDIEHQVLLTQHDVLLTVDDWRELHGHSKDRKKRTAGIHPNTYEKRWTNNIVNYYLDDPFSLREMNEFRQAIADWERYTCLKFRETTTATPRIRVKNGLGCSSYVGMRQWSTQDLNLAPGCRYKRIIVHEFGHAIGLHHEQTRPDRDQYVTINYHNIQNGVEYNFQKFTWNEIMNTGIPYDYNSIMHYGSHDFSYNGGATVVPKDSRYTHSIGRVQNLSFGDIKTVNLMYDCHKAATQCNLTPANCPSNGFLSKDCTCWCPSTDSAYKVCASTGTTGGITTKRPIVETTTKKIVNPDCTDGEPNCPDWAKYDMCTSDNVGDYVSKTCRLSCGLCSAKPTTVSPSPINECKDYYEEQCKDWAELDFCFSSPETMNSLCPKSCNRC